MHLRATARAKSGFPRTCDYLCEQMRNADPSSLQTADIDGQTPLHYAASNGHAEVIAVLCRQGYDIDHVDKVRQATPLLWAAEKGHHSAVKCLIEHQCDVTHVNRYQQNARQLLMTGSKSAPRERRGDYQQCIKLLDDHARRTEPVRPAKRTRYIYDHLRYFNSELEA